MEASVLTHSGIPRTETCAWNKLVFNQRLSNEGWSAALVKLISLKYPYKAACRHTPLPGISGGAGEFYLAGALLWLPVLWTLLATVALNRRMLVTMLLSGLHQHSFPITASQEAEDQQCGHFPDKAQ